jgi:hypothetical protein
MTYLNARTSKTNNKLTFSIALLSLLAAILGCGKTKPVPSEYAGHWTGSNGAIIDIRADGTGSYKSGPGAVNSTVDGSVEINDAEKTLSVKFVGVGPTFKIDKAPSGDQMTLDGIVFKKGGGSDSKSDKSSSDSKSDKPSSDSKSDSGSGDMPSDDKLQSLARGTILDFNSAVQSGDFTDFHSKISSLWKEQNSADEIKDIFQQFVDNKDNFDFSAVKSMKANFSPAPSFGSISGRKTLELKGNYDTKPLKTKFELKYLYEDGSWKLAGIRINTKDE